MSAHDSAHVCATGTTYATNGSIAYAQPEDSEKEVSVLRDAKLAVIESVWGHAGE